MEVINISIISGGGPTLATYLIGATYTLLSLPGLFLNVAVMVAIYRCGLLSRGAGSVFILATCAMTDCVIRLSIFAFYYGPSILLQRNLGDSTDGGPFGPFSYHITQLMFASWEVGSCTELIIASDRLLTLKRVIIDSRVNIDENEGLFSRRNCIIYVVCAFPMMLAFQYFAMWITGCCKGYFVHSYYAIVFDIPPGGYNHFFYSLLRYIAAFCTFASSACYIAIFAIITRAHARNRAVVSSSVTSSQADAALAARRRREQYSCLQFALAYLFYFLLWMTFELLPYLPTDPPYWFSLQIYVAIVDCSTTAIIQALMNTKMEVTNISIGRGDSLTLVSQIIGATYTLFCLPGLFLNVAVMVAIYRCGLLSRGAGSVFILATCAMTDCVIRLSVFAFYYGPSILLQRYLGDSAVFGPFSYHMTQLVFASWEVGSCTELIIAADRLLTLKRVIIDSRVNIDENEGPFSRRNCIIYVVCAFPMLLAFQYFAMWITPCCKGYFVHDYFAIVFDIPPGGYNHFFYSLIRYIAGLCTFASSACYIAIFAIITRAHTKNRAVVSSSGNASQAEAALAARRRREQYSCLQFALAYLFYFLLWMTFELLPYLPTDPPYWFSLQIYVAIVDCSTTAIIQALMNTRIRGELVRMFKTTFTFVQRQNEQRNRAWAC